jgi:uncharacterized OB-fold protein
MAIDEHRIAPAGGPLPALTPWNEAWFTSGTIAVQRCTACQARQHPPEEVCHRCGEMSFDTTVLRPTGTVHSHTIVHYPVNRELARSVPYAVVLVALDDAPEIRVVGNLDAPLEQVEIGLPVVACWEERTDPDGTVILLPQWRPAGST